MSKASVIREFLVKNPDMGPTELAELVSKNSKLSVTPTDVSVTKFNMNNSNKSKTPRKTRTQQVRATSKVLMSGLTNFANVLEKAETVSKLAKTMSVSKNDLTSLLTVAEKIGLKNTQMLLNVFSK